MNVEPNTDPRLGPMRRFSRTTYESIASAGHLSMADVSRLLGRVAGNPDDRDARLALLGANIVPTEVRGLQILWFIQNEPWTSLGMYSVFMDRALGQHDLAATYWRTAIAKFPDDICVFENAIWFLATRDPVEVERLLVERTSRLPDDADSWELAAVVFEFIASCEPKRAENWLSQSLAAAFRSFAVDDEPRRRLHLIPSMRAISGQIPRFDQLRLLDLAFEADRNPHNLTGSERRQGMSIAVGFVALADGDHTRALACLNEALEFCSSCESLGSLAEVLRKRGFGHELRRAFESAHTAHTQRARFLREWLDRFDSEPSTDS